jgi:hypothetical protein
MANLNEVYYDGVPEIRVSGWELVSSHPESQEFGKKRAGMSLRDFG